MSILKISCVFNCVHLQLILMLCINYRYPKDYIVNGQEDARRDSKKGLVDFFISFEQNYGVPANVLICRQLDSKYVDMAISMYTDDRLYLITNFWTITVKDPRWNAVKDVSHELNSLNIKPKEKPKKTKRQQCHQLTATFYTFGEFNVVLAWQEIKFGGIVGTPIHILHEVSVVNITECIPKLNITDCFSFYEPLKIHITQYISISGTVVESCDTPVPHTYHWRLYDRLETNLIIALNDTNEPYQHIPSYTFNIKSKDKRNKDHAILQMSTTLNGINVVARCHIMIVSGKIISTIAGGPSRSLNNKKQILMDGRESRDQSLPESTKKQVNFLWSCESDTDKNNDYCKMNQSKESMFFIPKNVLKIGVQYKFTLKVTALDDDERYATDLQTISIYDENVLNVRIICLKNCGMDRYNPEKRVHLKADCEDCKNYVKVAYEWSVLNTVIAQTRVMVAFIKGPTNKVTVALKVYAPSGFRTVVYKELTKNFGPANGSCSVTPKTGYEIKTNFLVNCVGIQSSNAPLTYFHIAQKVIIKQCGNRCYISLPTTDHFTTRVCDSSMECYEYKNLVNVKPWLQVESVRKVLSFGETNVKQLLQDGEEVKAYLVLNTVASLINTPDELDVILEQFEHHHPKEVIELGKMANLTRSAAESLNPLDDMETKSLTKLLHLLNENFATIIENGDVANLGLAPFLNITQACVTLLSMFTNITEALPLPPELIYKMIRNKTLTEELVGKIREEVLHIEDPEALDRSLVFLDALWEVERLSTYLGFAATLNIKPEEDHVRVVTDGIALEILCLYVDGQISQTVRTADGVHLVFFSAELMLELVKREKDRSLCLKVISIVRRLHWWFPEERQPSSRVLSVRAYAEGSVPTEMNYEISNKVEIFVVLGKYKPAQRLERHEIMSDPEDYVRVNVLSQENRLRSTREDIHSVIADEIYEEDDTWQWMLGPDINIMAFSPTQSQTNNRNINNSMVLWKQMDKNSVIEDNVPSGRQARVVEDDEIRASTQGKWYNCLVNDSIATYETTHMFTTEIDAASILAVHFTRSTHDIRVYLSMTTLPKRLDIATSDCIIPRGTRNKTCLLVNKCQISRLAFMGIRAYSDTFKESCSEVDRDERIPDGPAEFSFVFQIRACDYWLYSAEEPRWDSDGCLPAMEYSISKGMRCTCDHISTYTAYVFNKIAVPYPMWACSYEKLPTSREFVIFYIVFWLVLILLVLLSLHFGKNRNVTYSCKMVVEEENFSDPIHELEVYIKTAGTEFSGTTANVHLVFQTTSRDELHFTIYQNPEKPVLRKNTTHAIKLCTRDIRLPTKIAVSHDNSGRYPSWFCHSIIVIDLQTQQCQIFEINRWILRRQLVVVNSPVFKESDHVGHKSWWQRFKRSMERYFTNWALFQPIFGDWLLSLWARELSRFERICIWTAKIAVSATIVALYYGPTTIDTYERERMYFAHSSIVIWSDLAFLCVICYIAVTMVQLGYEYVVIPIAYSPELL